MNSSKEEQKCFEFSNKYSFLAHKITIIGALRQGNKARKVILEVCVSFELQCTVSGR